MKKIIRKNVKGDSTYLATIIASFFIIVLFIGCLDIFGEAIKINDVTRIHRRYLIKMERDGCLTAAEQTAMIAELEALGVTNISLAGTSFVPVGYSNPVRLVITCDVPVSQVNLTGTSPTSERSTRNVTIDKTATALYGD